MLKSLLEPDPLRDPVVRAEIEVYQIDGGINRLSQIVRNEAADISHLANDMRELADRLEALATNGRPL